jgi:hypothetical protein
MVSWVICNSVIVLIYFYFQNNCTAKILNDNSKQIDVLVVIGSLNITDDSIEKTIVPIPNPISLEGHISPLKAIIRFLTE